MKSKEAFDNKFPKLNQWFKDMDEAFKKLKESTKKLNEFKNCKK